MAGIGKPGPRRKKQDQDKKPQHGNSKITEDRIQIITSTMSVLVPLEVSARAAGINRDTLRNWLKQGKTDQDAGRDTLYADFFRKVDQAEAFGEAKAVKGIYDSGPNGQLALLRSRFPTRWAETQRLQVEVEKTQGEMLDALKDGLEPDEYVKVVAVLRAASTQQD